MNNDYYMKDWSSGGEAGGDAVRDAEGTPAGCRENKLPWYQRMRN